MKRVVAACISVSLVLMLMSGCGQKAAENTAQKTVEATKTSEGTQEQQATQKESTIKGKITFITNRTDKADTTIKDMTKEFMNKYPGTEVEVESTGDAASVLKIRMASNELPDVTLVLPTVKKQDYSKYFAPIDDLGFNNDNIYFYQSGIGDGDKLYAISDTVVYHGMIYNKNAFKVAGIEKAPTTMDEFYAACDKLKAKGIVPVASNFKDKWPLIWYYANYPILSTGNANYTNELANKDEILSNDNGIMSAFEILRNMKDKGYLEKDLMSTNWDGMKKDHAAGKIAMAFLGTWYPPQVVDNGAKLEDLGMIPFPGTKTMEISPDQYFGISKNSENIDTAKAFLKFAWEDSRYVKACGTLSPLKNAEKPTEPFIKELLSYNLPIVEQASATDEYTAIFNKSQIDLMTVAQEYMIAKDTNEVVKKYNAIWAQARKALAK